MRELVKLGVDVHVALPPDGPLVDKYEAAGIVVHPLKLDFPIKQPWLCHTMFGELRDLVACVEPTIIHSHFVGTTLTMRLALGRAHPIPRIFQVPGPLHLEHPFFRWSELLTAGPSDYWVGSCMWTYERYRASGISPDRLFLSYYGIDRQAFSAGQGGKLRAELGLSPHIKLVGMVAFMYGPKWFLGQKRGLKGHEDLIDAVALCLKTNSDIACVFIGGAWNDAHAYEQRVRAYARKRLGEHAIFLGTRNDVSELYPDLDVVVHPSHSENVGGAAESLLLAVPTIATNVGGFPDLVTEGATGWLVPPSSPAKLAIAILAALSAPEHAQALARQGQQRALQLFDVEQSARQVLEIYETVRFRRMPSRSVMRSST